MEENPTVKAGSRCHRCGTLVPTLWTYCEPCRKAIAVEDPHEAREELSWRWEIEENRRRS
jgi:hypothetical protein